MDEREWKRYQYYDMDIVYTPLEKRGYVYDKKRGQVFHLDRIKEDYIDGKQGILLDGNNLHLIFPFVEKDEALVFLPFDRLKRIYS